MNIFNLFFGIVLAAETSILSPLGSDWQPPVIKTPTPDVSFGMIMDNSQNVLGDSTESLVVETPTPTPKPTYRTTRQNSYTIAFLGDSMVDTLGPNIADLSSRLKKVYPLTSFHLVNYGVGGTNIDYGLSRINNPYDYLGNHIPALTSIKPDVVVIESFGYNPFVDDHNYLDRHWLALASVVDSLRGSIPGVKLLIASTIAPNANIFGDGVLNWNAEQKQQKVATIKTYLENAVKFAQSQHLPLVDAYHPSLDGSGNGKLVYINAGDHIHYSDAGRMLFAQKTLETLVNNRILE